MVSNTDSLDFYRPLTAEELVDSKNKKKFLNFTKKNEEKSIPPRTFSSLELKLRSQNKSLKNFRFLKEAYSRLITKNDSGLQRHWQQRAFFKKLSYIKRESKTLFDLVLKMSSGTKVSLRELYFTKIQFKDSQANVLDFFYKKYKRPYRWILDLTFLLGYSDAHYLKWCSNSSSIYGQRGPLTLLKLGFPAHYINSPKLISNYLELPLKITKESTFFNRFLKARLLLNINTLEYIYLTGYQFTQTFNNLNLIKLYSKRYFVYTYFNYKPLQVLLKQNISENSSLSINTTFFKKKNLVNLLRRKYFFNGFIKNQTNLNNEYLIKAKLLFRIRITNFIKPHCFSLFLPKQRQNFFLFSLFPNINAKKLKSKLVSRRNVRFPLNNLIILQFPDFLLIDYSLFSFCLNNNSKKSEVSLQLEQAFPNAHYYPIWFRSCFIY